MKHVSITTEPIVTNIKDVNRISFHIFFPIKKEDKDTINRIMLKRFLVTGSKKYNTPEKMGNEYLSNMILDYDVTFFNRQNLTFLECTLIVPKEDIIDNYSIEGALKFFYEMVFNPKVKNNAFDREAFDEEKEYLIQNESEFPRDINEYAYEEFFKFVDPEEKDHIHQDTYMKLLGEVTPESVYDYYTKIVTNNNYFAFIGGNIGGNSKVVDKFNKIFKQRKKIINLDIEYYNISNIEDYQEKVLKTEYNQSMVFIQYNIKDYNEKDNFKLRLLSYLLDSRENNLFFNKLRGENSIIYTYNSSFKRFKGEILIVLYVDKSNIDLGKKIVNEVFDIIKDKEVFERCKSKTLKAMTYDVLSEDDKPFKLQDDAIGEYLAYDRGLKEDIKILEKVSYEDIMELLDRLIQTRTMIVESGDNDE